MNNISNKILPKRYIAVIGGSVADIQGFCETAILPGESNIGSVSFSSGGVARNVAENLAHLKLPVILFSAIGNDFYGKTVISNTKKSGVDTSFVKKTTKYSTAVYLALFDHHKDLHSAIAGMEIFNTITPEYLKNNYSILNNAEIIVADTNLSQETLKYLAENFSHKKIFIDPVSLAKAKKIIPYIGLFHTIKPNLNEAEILSGIKITDLHSAEQAGKKLITLGCQNCVISMAEKGVIAINKKETIHLTAPKVSIKSVSGAGDSFMAGLIYGAYNNFSLKKSAEFAQKMAVLTLQSEKTISEEIINLKG